MATYGRRGKGATQGGSLKQAVKGGVRSEAFSRAAPTLSSPLASWRKRQIPWHVLLEVCHSAVPPPRPSTGDIPPFHRCRFWTGVMMAKAGAGLGPPHPVRHLTRFAFVSPPRSLDSPGAASLPRGSEHMVIQRWEGTHWPNSPTSNFHP